MKQYRLVLAVALAAALLAFLLEAHVHLATKPTIGLQSASTATVGRPLRVTVTVRNAAPLRSLLILEKVGTRWQRVATPSLSKGEETTTVTLTPTTSGEWTLRAACWYAHGSLTAETLSNVLVVSVSAGQ